MNTKQHWLEAPDNVIDQSIREMIRDKWDDEPTSIQILEVVDHVVHWGAGSDLAVHLLDLRLRAALASENKILDDILPDAVWRLH